MKHLSFSAILMSLLLFPFLLMAQSSLNYGPRAKSLAGAGTANIENSIWGNGNPGGQVFLGQKIGVGIELSMPKASYQIIGEPTQFEPSMSSMWPLGLEPGLVEASNQSFVIPQIAINMVIDDDNSLGFSIYGNANKGTQYESKTYYSQVIADFGSSEGFINPMGTVTSPCFLKLKQYFGAISYSRKITNKIGLGLSLVGAWQSLNIGGLEAFGSLHYAAPPKLTLPF